MSNFTYEIDERNLRLKLKEFMVPVKEEAWQKFENSVTITVNHQRESRLKFNFSLNRNVVLPSVFGVIIILFSFLLVNFVSIKSPVKESGQKAEITPLSNPRQDEPKQQAVPVKAEQKQTEMTSPNTTVADIKPEEKVILTNLVSAPETLAPQTTPQQAIITEPNGDSIAANPSDEEAKAKRRAERRAARAEAQKLEEIRPTPVAEEHDVEEVRPD